MSAVAISPAPSIAQTIPHAESHYFVTTPALWMACCFAIGIFAGYFLWQTPGVLLVAMGFLFAVIIVSYFRALRIALAATGCLFVLLGLFCEEVAPRADEQKQLALLADGSQHTFIGHIISLGSMRDVQYMNPYSSKVRAEHSQQVDLELSSVTRDTGEMAPLHGTLRLSIHAPVEQEFPHLACGGGLQGQLTMHLEERFLDPGVWDASAYLHEQRIGAFASVSAQKLTVVASRQRVSWLCLLHAWQQEASVKLIAFADYSRNMRFPSWLRITREDATMLTAMLTGDRTYLVHLVRVGFERTGSFHLLVVSGMHLAIFSSLIFWLARQFRLPRTWASVITVVLSFGYAFFTGFGQPVQRAFWMVTLYLVGRLLWRERQPLNAIGFAALMMMVAYPGMLFEAGFQMTLLSVLAVAGIAAPIAEHTFGPYLRASCNLWVLPIDPALPPRIAQFRVSLRIIAQALRPWLGKRIAFSVFPYGVRLCLQAMEVVTVSAAIELLMAIPMAIYFHRITALALPVNILIVPFLGLLLPSALLALATIVLAPAVAFVPASVTAVLLHCVTVIVRFFGNMRAGDLRISSPTSVALAVSLAFIVIAIYVVRLQRFGLCMVVAALCASAVIVMFPRPLSHRADALEVSAIDVGQGDSILVITPDGKTLLIDAGGIVGASPDSNFDVGEDVVSPMLWSRGIRRLDAVAITHAHADHIGGMAAVLANFKPRELWIGTNPDSPMYHRVMDEAVTVGAHVMSHRCGDTFSFGDAVVRVLSPAVNYQPAGVPKNDDSLVMRLSYGNTSALLEGDAEAPSEVNMVAAGGLKSDLLKVGHHGSKTSTTPEFLNAVAPSYAAISVGRRNFYGHPRHEILEELQDAHVKTFRTDMLGLSTFYLDGSHVIASPWAATRP